jgi:hypothetical protein
MSFSGGQPPDPVRVVYDPRAHRLWKQRAEKNIAAINGPTRRTSAPKRLRQTFQVLWPDLDQAMPRSIDVGYQKEGSRNDKW